MNTVILCENPVEESTWVTHQVEDVCQFLKEHFKTWPDSARIYHDQVSLSNDVTPYDESSIQRLEKLTGKFYVVIYPEGIETIFIVIAIAVAAVSIGLSFLLRPSASPNVKSQNESSPNNELAKRDNRARPGERIPDIYGKLWATPDLIQVPYRIFDGTGTEIEYCYMCIGRGEFTIAAVRDDLTPIDEITGSSVEVYPPLTSPNSGAPQLRIGAAINEPLRTVRPLNSINGQSLIAPNLTGGGLFSGPFLIGDSSTTEIWCNFVAQSGLYAINNTGAQIAQSADIQVGLTPCDAAGNALGIEILHNITINGSAVSKQRIGITQKIVLPASGTYLIRAKRTSNTTITAGTSVVDEIQWREALAITPVTNLHFGNVTTVQTLSLPTPNALALKQRKLNLLLTRNVLKGTLAGGAVTFTPNRQPSVIAADIINDIALDARLGNRQSSELDLPGIYQAMSDITTYFGTSRVIEFCFTFDDSKVSFEEMVQDIAASIFCNAYRRGNVISIFFEKLAVNSKMLFNHRNKIPKSETRTVTFGYFQDNDGITLEYTDPNAPNFPNQDTITSIYFPEDQSAINPKKITAVGVRNNVQAKLLGWRYYQKLKFQNTAVEFEATHEAAMRILNERILVADNTRPDTQDGEIVAQNGLVLTTSQPVNMPNVTTGFGSLPINWTVFLQHYDDTVEAIGCVQSGANQITLNAPPSIPLIMGVETFARTTYIIVADRGISSTGSVVRSSAFLLSEKTPKQKNTYTVKAVNYDANYYSHDTDVINGIITDHSDAILTPGIAPGGTYRPIQYNDVGSFPTLHPDFAYDTNPATAAVISGHAVTSVGPPVITTVSDGDCIYSGFPSLSFTADTTLHIKYTGLSAGIYTNIQAYGAALVFLADTGTEITFKVPAGTHIGFIMVEAFATADVNITDNFLSILDVYIA